MATLTDLIKSDKKDFPALDGYWYGKIVTPVPSTANQLMNVVIPDIDDKTVWTGCRWPKSALSILALNKEVLVLFDNRQQLWVVGVW